MNEKVMTGVYIKDEESFNFDFYTDLSAANKLRFVNSVVELLIDDTHYNSIIRDLIFNFYLIDIFTNIDTSEIKESNFFINDVEKLLKETNIIDIINANVRDGLIDELNEAVDKSIEYRTGIHRNILSESLASLINTIKDKIDNIDTNAMMEMANKINNLSGELTPENIVKAYLNSDSYD